MKPLTIVKNHKIDAGLCELYTVWVKLKQLERGVVDKGIVAKVYPGRIVAGIAACRKMRAIGPHFKNQ